MKLYHFSNCNFNIIKPNFFGINSYTKNDSKYKQKRFFCYDTRKPKEHCFNSVDYRYTINIDKKKIYNLDKDALKLKEKFNFDIDKILNYTAKNFEGISYISSFKTYCIFKSQQVTRKEKHKQGINWN